jgi:hypothetical protein
MEFRDQDILVNIADTAAAKLMINTKNKLAKSV